ncbi:MAG: glycosyltransferase family 39 protein [Bdellovibrionota bacterium]
MLQKRIFNILVIVLFLKLVFALAFPLVGDEAYYWFWGQNLQLSYFDHPGMVAWLAALSDYLPITPKWAATRLVFVALSMVAFFVWIKVFLKHRQNSPNINQELNIFSIFFMLNPFLGLGSVLITPDSPLLLFWGLSSYFVLKIMREQKSIDYALLGVSLGLGFCSKYHIVLFPLVTIAALYFEKNLKVFFSKKVLVTILFGLLFCSPVLIWNYQNDFASFKFQLNHGLNEAKPYQFWWTSTYLIGQVLLFNPALVFSMCFKFKKSLFNISALGQWLFFLYSSFKAKVEANWPLTSHVSGLMDLDGTRKKIIRYSFFYYTILWIGLPVFFFTDFGQKKVAALPTSLTINELSSELLQYQPLYGPTYQISSLLTLLTDIPVYKLHGLSRYDFFDSLPKSHPTEKLFYVLKYKSSEWPVYYENFSKTKVTEFPKFKLEVFELRYE